MTREKVENTKEACPICSSRNTISIEIGRKSHMRSDGVIFDKKLVKFHCNGCGLLFKAADEATPPSPPYKRSNGKSEADIRRHKHVAKGIDDLLKNLFKASNKTLKILEVGAGNHMTSSMLASSNVSCSITSLEPYPENEDFPDNPNLIVHTGCLNTLAPDQSFDLIFSNHVLEHMECSNGDELFLHRDFLKDDGYIVFIVPAPYPASEELLFSDHLFTFTQQAINLLFNKYDLNLVSSCRAGWDQFSSIHIANKKIARQSQGECNELESNLNLESLLESRLKLSNKWSHSPEDFCNKVDGTKNVVIFGAGEYAQLIQCFYPEVYELVDFHVVSSFAGARNFPKPVKALEDANLQDVQCIVGAHKSSLPAIVELIKEKGGIPLLPPTLD